MKLVRNETYDDGSPISVFSFSCDSRNMQCIAPRELPFECSLREEYTPLTPSQLMMECPVDSDSEIGNGICDSRFNIPDCNFDDGDCCRNSCIPKPGIPGSCALFECRDSDSLLDNISPILHNLPPAEITVSPENIPPPAKVYATDNNPCFDANVIYKETSQEVNLCGSFKLTRKWTVLDPLPQRNKAEYEQIIHVEVTCQPSSAPSISKIPSLQPSKQPSRVPSAQPSISSYPSHQPTLQPSISVEPSSQPSRLPSNMPSQGPSTSSNPSSQPSSSPSVMPSQGPSISSKPSSQPSSEPSSQPSIDPTGSQVATITVAIKLVNPVNGECGVKKTCVLPFRGKVAILPRPKPFNAQDAPFYYNQETMYLGSKETDDKGIVIMNHDSWDSVVAIACIDTVCDMQQVAAGMAKLRFMIHNMEDGSTRVSASSSFLWDVNNVVFEETQEKGEEASLVPWEIDSPTENPSLDQPTKCTESGEPAPGGCIEKVNTRCCRGRCNKNSQLCTD